MMPIALGAVGLTGNSRLMLTANLDIGSLRLGFIGAGRFGCALAWALESARCTVHAAASRDAREADRLAGKTGSRRVTTAQAAADECDVVFVTRPDGAMASTIAALNWPFGIGVVHCSGASSVDALVKAAADDALIGGFHPADLRGLRGCGPHPGRLHRDHRGLRNSERRADTAQCQTRVCDQPSATRNAREGSRRYGVRVTARRRVAGRSGTHLAILGRRRRKCDTRTPSACAKHAGSSRSGRHCRGHARPFLPRRYRCIPLAQEAGGINSTAAAAAGRLCSNEERPKTSVTEVTRPRRGLQTHRRDDVVHTSNRSMCLRLDTLGLHPRDT